MAADIIDEDHRPDFGHDGQAQCGACGRSVNEEVGRVLGDTDRTVPCCTDCAISPAGRQYGTTARAVRNYRDPRATVIVEVEG